MSTREVGQRIGALLSSDEEDRTVQFLGFGTYDGDQVPPPEIEGLGEFLHTFGVPSPKLTLDNGSVVWGCECWWGDEAAIQSRIIRWLDEGWIIEQLDANWRGKNGA